MLPSAQASERRRGKLHLGETHVTPFSGYPSEPADRCGLEFWRSHARIEDDEGERVHETQAS